MRLFRSLAAALLLIWPMVAMNVVLAGINLWFIVQLLRERDDEAAFEVLAMGADDAYLRHFLRVHSAELAKFQPDFEPSAISRPAVATYLVQRGTETVGVVVVQQEGGDGHVLLDYVTPRYRDFSPGTFVWRQAAGCGTEVSRGRNPAGDAGAVLRPPAAALASNRGVVPAEPVASGAFH